MKRPLAPPDAGRHNGDLAASTARLVGSGTYKRNRVVLLVPAIAPIPPRVYLSHIALVFPPNQAAHRMLCVGDEVGVAYSNSIAQIVDHPELSKWEWIATLETDNCPPSDGLVKLITRMHQNPQFSAISGLYYCKGDGGWSAPHIWGDPRDPVCNYRPQPPVPGQLVECCGLSQGFCLYRMSLFRDPNISRPWFETKAGREGVGTQDLAFWAKARRCGHRCAVDCDVLVGHYDYTGQYGQPDMMW